MKKYPCPCCGHQTHTREDHRWDICPVCFWQDDALDLDRVSGANHISRREARRNFVTIGACSRTDLPFVRPPLADEPRDPFFDPNLL